MAGTSVTFARTAMRGELLVVLVGGLFLIPLLTLMSLTFTDVCADNPGPFLCRSGSMLNTAVFGPVLGWFAALALGVWGQRVRRAGGGRTWLFVSLAVFAAAVTSAVVTLTYLNSL
ncbi:hypothetical protein GCM10009765_41710 [Fodinicola feengrottensis]|uniref:Transmembrane protein n=1 Tax=Fodinicola feengrottensis TaxID=435914 RepID=A0ABN2HH66_9ACTN